MTNFCCTAVAVSRLKTKLQLTKLKQMKKTNNRMSSKDKKAKKPKHLGDFGFTCVTTVNDKKHEAKTGKGVITQSLHCDDCFKTRFTNSQGSGEHQETCKAFALLKEKQEAKHSIARITEKIGSDIFTNP